MKWKQHVDKLTSFYMICCIDLLSKQNRWTLQSSINAVVLFVFLLCPGSLLNPFDILVKSLHKASTSVGTANGDGYQKVKLDNCGRRVLFCYLHSNFFRSSVLSLACCSAHCHPQFYFSIFTSWIHPSVLIAGLILFPAFFVLLLYTLSGRSAIRLHLLLCHILSLCVVSLSLVLAFQLMGINLFMPVTYDLIAYFMSLCILDLWERRKLKNFCLVVQSKGGRNLHKDFTCTLTSNWYLSEGFASVN